MLNNAMSFGPALRNFLAGYRSPRLEKLWKTLEKAYTEWKSYTRFDTHTRPDGSKELVVDLDSPGLSIDISRVSVVYDDGSFSLHAHSARGTHLYVSRRNLFNRLLTLSLNAEAFRQHIFDKISQRDSEVEEAVLFPGCRAAGFCFSEQLARSNTIDSYIARASYFLRVKIRLSHHYLYAFDRIDTAKFENGLWGALKSDVRAERFRAIRELVRDVPLPVLRAMGASGVRTIHMANYLLADGDPQKQKYRCQAVLAHPVLMGMVFHECVATLAGRHAGILQESAAQVQTIDDLFAVNERRGGAPHPLQGLLQAIDDNTGKLNTLLADYPLSETGETLDPIQISALAKVRSWPRDQERSYGADAKTILDLKKLDPSWLPRTSQSFADFIQFSKMTKEFVPFGFDPDALLRLPRGQWTHYVQQIGSVQAITDINDWYNDVFNLMLAPTVLENMPFYYPSQEAFEAIKGACKAAFCAAYTPMKLLECSTRWHDPDFQAGHKDARTALAVELDRTWLPLTDRPFTSRAGIIVRALSSHQELEQAGKSLRHCVGSSDTYWKRCMDGSAHIIALYEEHTGALLTTVEVSERINKGARVLTPGQHQGLGRRGPTLDERNAVIDYLEAIQNHPDYVPDWARIDAERARVRTIISNQHNTLSHTRYCGFDPWDPDTRAKAFKLARAFLPHSDRCITPAAAWSRISAAVPLNDLA